MISLYLTFYALTDSFLRAGIAIVGVVLFFNAGKNAYEAYMRGRSFHDGTFLFREVDEDGNQTGQIVGTAGEALQPGDAVVIGPDGRMRRATVDDVKDLP